jgi:hypothetical protein
MRLLRAHRLDEPGVSFFSFLYVRKFLTLRLGAFA